MFKTLVTALFVASAAAFAPSMEIRTSKTVVAMTPGTSVVSYRRHRNTQRAALFHSHCLLCSHMNFFGFSTDKKTLASLESHTDADRAVLMECDDEGCVMVSGYNDGDGNWNFNGGLEDMGRQATTRKVLMMDVEDCE